MIQVAVCQRAVGLYSWCDRPVIFDASVFGERNHVPQHIRLSINAHINMLCVLAWLGAQSDDEMSRFTATANERLCKKLFVLIASKHSVFDVFCTKRIICVGCVDLCRQKSENGI